MDDLQSFASRAASVSETDQRAAFIVDIATDVAAYHRKLVESKVPRALAAELTLQAAGFLWNGPGCCHGDES
jgi:hypothetical protein